MSHSMADSMAHSMAASAFFGTWAASMAGMMLPSELPLFRLDYATARSPSRTAALAAGYLVAWVALGAPVWIADRLLDGRVLGAHSHVLTASVLGAAALYQLTPLKRRCLAVCRAPLARMFHGWHDGFAGALRMGIENGFWCAGCCVGLMAVLLALGMMSVAWMAVVAAAIFLEKATRVGVASSRLAAAALAIVAVAWTL